MWNNEYKLLLKWNADGCIDSFIVTFSLQCDETAALPLYPSKRRSLTFRILPLIPNWRKLISTSNLWQLLQIKRRQTSVQLAIKTCFQKQRETRCPLRSWGRWRRPTRHVSSFCGAAGSWTHSIIRDKSNMLSSFSSTSQITWRHSYAIPKVRNNRWTILLAQRNGIESSKDNKILVRKISLNKMRFFYLSFYFSFSLFFPESVYFLSLITLLFNLNFHVFFTIHIFTLVSLISIRSFSF